jgi:hypothetical protein
MTDLYKVSIKGPGINVERKVSEVQANQLLVALVTGRTPPKEGGPPGSQEIEADSIAEYLGAASAKSAPERITAIGAFLTRYRDRKSFNREDLETAFQDAAESVPKNLHRDIKNTVREGWIAPRPGEKGLYYVTKTGLQAVNDNFQRGSKRTITGAKGRKTAQTATSN